MSEYVSPIDRAHVLLAEARELSSRTADNLDRKDVRGVVTLGVTEKDLEALAVIAAADGRIRNYGVLIRRLISREAKRLNSPPKTCAGESCSCSPEDAPAA